MADTKGKEARKDSVKPGAKQKTPTGKKGKAPRKASVKPGAKKGKAKDATKTPPAGEQVTLAEEEGKEEEEEEEEEEDSPIMRYALALLCILMCCCSAVLFSRYTWILNQAEELAYRLVDTNNKMAQLDSSFEDVQQKVKSGWKLYEDSIYHVGNTSMTFNNSAKQCKGQGAKLVTVARKKVQLFLEEEAKAAKADLWIGLQWETNKWKWPDGTELTTPFWAAGQPDGDPSDKACVEISHTCTTREECWNNVRCEEKKRPVCEVDLKQLFIS
ncbi:C-type lectin domain family 4 member E isoform X2 [Anolis carolinensis]|uniref:C-type lectin domain family 4 member E isoform X2 n=1 Tax=Anolis carolinensis TaxID=28377 RepID=UPI002F2B8CD9